MTFSSQGVSILDGMNSVYAGNGLVIDRTGGTIVVNYNNINIAMGDSYFGAIYGGNIGGGNSTNHGAYPILLIGHAY